MTSCEDLEGRFDGLKSTLAPADGLYCGGLHLLGHPQLRGVEEIGSAHGLVDNKSCAIDVNWQALRFVYRLSDHCWKTLTEPLPPVRAGNWGQRDLLG